MDRTFPALPCRAHYAAIDKVADLRVGRVAVDPVEFLVFGAAEPLAPMSYQDALLTIGDGQGPDEGDVPGRAEVEDWGVSQGDRELAVHLGKLRRPEEAAPHLLEHARHSFAFFPHHAQRCEHADDQRIAARVDRLARVQLLEPNEIGWHTRAQDLHPVVEEPYLRFAGRGAVVAVRDRVDNGLLPGEVRVLGHLAEEEVVQARGSLDEGAPDYEALAHFALWLDVAEAESARGLGHLDRTIVTRRPTPPP